MSRGLYVHIPFCARKCNYCDFISLPYDESLKDRYLRALAREIEECTFGGRVGTVYIGGGTPSLLSPSDTGSLLETIVRKFDVDGGAEMTLEVNPGTIDPSKVRALRDMGINRLSIGIQSLDPGELAVLGRVHDAVDSRNALEWAARYFDNFSVDVMYGLPGQEPSGLRDTLEGLLAYGPPHVSAYELTVEEGTPLSCMVSSGLLTLPSDDGKAAMHELVAELLGKRGYHHYEISNYAREGFHCRHNMNYWTRGEYLGFGAAAHAFDGTKRTRNSPDVAGYIRLVEGEAGAVVEEDLLTMEDRAKEEILLGLRTSRGIETDLPPTASARIMLLEQEGLLLREGNRLRLTEKGMLLSNRVIVEILDSMEEQDTVTALSRKSLPQNSNKGQGIGKGEG